MKKIIVMLLCLALMLSLATVSFAAVADIRIEAEKPSDKAVHTEFHRYSWEPEGSTKGVDHTKRVLADDGLEYTNAEKNIINFAYLDSYTYTVDVVAAGTYELHALLDCDRDIEIHYTVNGGSEVKSNTYLGHTNGAGYAGKMEDQILGSVELVKGSNTLSFTAKAQEANVNIQMDAYVLVPVNVVEEPAELPEILKGTPTVDGKLDDMYKQSLSMEQGKDPAIWVSNAGDPDDVKATVYFLHDGEFLYVCAVVTGDSAIIDTEASGWACDGVDVWFLTPAAPSDATRTKITLDAFGQAYDADNKYIGDHENGLNVDLSKIEKAAVRTENGYVTEAKIPVPYASESEGTIAINLQLNNIYAYDAASGNGSATPNDGKFGFYGSQFQTAPTTIVLSDTAVTTPDPEGPSKTGNVVLSVLAGLLTVSAIGGAVLIGKKKEF